MKTLTQGLGPELRPLKMVTNWLGLSHNKTYPIIDTDIIRTGSGYERVFRVINDDGKLASVPQYGVRQFYKHGKKCGF